MQALFPCIPLSPTRNSWSGQRNTPVFSYGGILRRGLHIPSIPGRQIYPEPYCCPLPPQLEQSIQRPAILGSGTTPAPLHAAHFFGGMGLGALCLPGSFLHLGILLLLTAVSPNRRAIVTEEPIHHGLDFLGHIVHAAHKRDSGEACGHRL